MGNAYFNNATVRGKVYAREGSFTGTVNATSGIFNNVTMQSGTIKEDVSIEGYINQVFPRAILGSFSFWTSSSSASSPARPVFPVEGDVSVNFRHSTFSLSNIEIKRISTGRYIFYFHRNWLENSSPVRKVIQKYPFSSGRYSYIINPIVIVASNTGSDQNNNTQHNYYKKNPLCVRISNTYSSNEIAVFGWSDGFWNDGLMYETSPNGISSMAVEFDFTDNNNDSFVDPDGGCHLILEFIAVPTGYNS